MKVLIVDDEPPARDRLRQLLDDTAVHQVIGEAGNGREALDVAAREKPDVVLLDWNMPVMDGMGFLKAMQDAGLEQAPIIIFCTTERSLNHIRRALDAGAAPQGA